MDWVPLDHFANKKNTTNYIRGILFRQFDDLRALKWETGWEEEEEEEMEVKTLQMKRVGLKKKKNWKETHQNSSDEGAENVDKGGPDTWTIPVGATIALNDDSDVR